MKRKKLEVLKKFLGMSLALSMLCTSVPLNGMAAAAEVEAGYTQEVAQDVIEEGQGEEPVWSDMTEEQNVTKAEENLENIASACQITVPSEQRPAGNMVDGDINTLWVNNGADWPCNVEFKLPAVNTKKVKKVVLKFEKGFADRSMTANMSYALNNVTGDKISINGSEKTFNFEEGYTFTFEQPQAMSHLYVTLSSPNAGFWPAVAEAEIYVDKDAEVQIDLENIAKTHASKITLDASVDNGSEKAKIVDEDETTAAFLHTKKLSELGDSSLPFAETSFGINQRMRKFILAMAKDSSGSKYEYQLLGKVNGGSEYTTITTGQIGTSDADYRQEIEIKSILPGSVDVEYESVKAVFGAANVAAENTIPNLAEFQIWSDKATIAEADSKNIAWNAKKLHSNYTTGDLSAVVDGNKKNTWYGDSYPAYVDIDLEALYDLSEIQVFTPSSGYSQYTLYVSEDGKDFTRVGKKTDKTPCPESGEIYSLSGVQGSVVRILLEYNSESKKAALNEIRVLGEKKGEQVKAQFVPPVSYEKSGYDVETTAQNTVSEVQGIVSRNLGTQYIDWFEFQLGQPGKYDYFTIENGADGKIKITGNDGVSIATGLNHYLKYYCNVSITQVGNQVKMPAKTVPVKKTVRKECKVPIRYAYNYCTMSYSMPFWGETEWRKELDWLALNGANVVLDLTGQEEVWRQFLTEIGYDHASAKDFIAGPAYYAWAYMANLSGFGGPVHDSWFVDRTELARKNHLIMENLGMEPVLQGYSGMVPNNITDYAKGDYQLTSNDIIKQGGWCSYQRPDMLLTTSDVYKKYAGLFYECQKKVYGDVSKYYATDPFHEGGNTGSMNVSDVSENVMRSMLQADPDAVWIIQAWQGNPQPALLEGLNKAGGTDYRNHTLILDLYAEKQPYWNQQNGYKEKEFNQSPWVYCMLNNFGGRMGLHGHLDNMVSGIVDAANNSNKLTGIGITPEGSQNNPVLYDFLFESVWCEDASKPLEKVNMSEWLWNYVTRRYGAESDNAYDAMRILQNTVYKASLNMNGQGAPESYINAKPAASIGAASSWGNSTISYNMGELEKAAKYLLEDYELLKDSDGYLYDLADILKQILSNASQKYHRAMVSAMNAEDLDEFKKTSDHFLELIDEVEKVLATRSEFLLGTWVEQARALAKDTDDFTKDLYEFNAKCLVTTWGAYDQGQSGNLLDYSNRQWAGLTKDYYKPRWEMWIEENKARLSGTTYKGENAFVFGWEFARSKENYTTQVSGADLGVIGKEVLEKFSSVDDSTASDASYDYPVSKLTASAGNYQDADGNRPSDVLDGNTSTLWHTKWGSATPRDDHYIILKLEDSADVTGLRYLPRTDGNNGLITGYQVFVSETGEEGSYVLAAEGRWDGNSSWKKAAFTSPVKAKYVKLQSVDSLSAEAGKIYSSAAEIRITTTEKAPVVAEYVRINPFRAVLTEGDTLQLKGTVRPAEASTQLVWKSESPAIASVNENGLVTALKSGTVKINAETTDGSNISENVLITVEPRVPGEEELKIASEKEKIRQIKKSNESKKEVDYTAVTWKAYIDALTAANKVLENENISLNEVVTARENLEKAVNSLVRKPQPVQPEVKVASIALSADTVNLAAGKKAVIKTVVSPANAKNKTMRFTSDNERYASVSTAGVVTAKKAGAGKSVKITALAQDGSGIRKEISFRIYKNPVSKIKLTAGNTAVQAGKNVRLKAAFTPSKEIYKSLAFTSSNTNYASVNSKGVVTTKKAGAGKSVKITAVARDGSKAKATLTLKLYKNSVQKLTLKSGAKFVKAGKTLKLTPVFKPSKDICKTLSFTSSNKRYAKVSSKGVIRTYRAGKGKTVKITARATDGSGKKAVCSIRIR